MGASKSVLLCYDPKHKPVKKSTCNLGLRSRQNHSISIPVTTSTTNMNMNMGTTTAVASTTTATGVAVTAISTVTTVAATTTAVIIQDLEKTEKEKKNTENVNSKDATLYTTWLYSLLIVNPMGKGKSSTVYKVYDRGTNFTYALKLMKRKNKFTDRVFKNESTLLQRLDCDRIIRFVYAYADDNHAFILTECGDIDLFSVIQRQKRMSERNTKKLIQSLLQTFAYLHDTCQIAHRDLKPENIVFIKSKSCEENDIPFDSPKVIDFGVATEIEDNWMVCNDRTGTPRYLAPERWGRHFGWEVKASDIWSIGVLTYEMVTGKSCFVGQTIEEIKYNVLKNKWRFPTSNCPSKLCMNFIKLLLSPFAHQRPSAQFALRHPWLLSSRDPESFQQSANEWNTLLVTRPSWTTYEPPIRNKYIRQTI